jgi:hypothetical protein
MLLRMLIKFALLVNNISFKKFLDRGMPSIILLVYNQDVTVRSIFYTLNFSMNCQTCS